MAFSPRLKPPPSSPNCVSSLADASDPVHHIAPLRVPGPIEEALGRVKAVVEAMPRTRITTVEDDYLHAVFTTAIFRWKDDVEFQVDADAGVVHVRSASRVGYGDLGANRKRVEAIRSALGAAG